MTLTPHDFQPRGEERGLLWCGYIEPGQTHQCARYENDALHRESWRCPECCEWHFGPLTESEREASCLSPRVDDGTPHVWERILQWPPPADDLDPEVERANLEVHDELLTHVQNDESEED